jgi:hypothetical protein
MDGVRCLGVLSTLLLAPLIRLSVMLTPQIWGSRLQLGNQGPSSGVVFRGIVQYVE